MICIVVVSVHGNEQWEGILAGTDVHALHTVGLGHFTTSCQNPEHTHVCLPLRRCPSGGEQGDGEDDKGNELYFLHAEAAIYGCVRSVDQSRYLLASNYNLLCFRQVFMARDAKVGYLAGAENARWLKTRPLGYVKRV